MRFLILLATACFASAQLSDNVNNQAQVGQMSTNEASLAQAMGPSGLAANAYPPMPGPMGAYGQAQMFPAFPSFPSFPSFPMTNQFQGFGPMGPTFGDALEKKAAVAATRRMFLPTMGAPILGPPILASPPIIGSPYLSPPIYGGGIGGMYGGGYGVGYDPYMMGGYDPYGSMYY